MSDTKLNEPDKTIGQDNAAVSPFGEEPDPGKNRRPADDIYTGQDFRSSKEKEEKKPASMGKDIFILVMITLVAGVLLGAAYSVTKSPIEAAQARARSKAQSAVMSDAENFEVLHSADGEGAEGIPEGVADALEKAGIGSTSVSQIDAAYDSNRNLIGYVITVSDPDGYGGDVELMCGISHAEDGSMTIAGISFLSLSETAGMGMRAKDDEFLQQFSDRNLGTYDQIVYSKSGAEQPNEIDAISGCTVTTSAVTDDVNAALIAVSEISGSDDGAAGSDSGAMETEQEVSE